MAGQVEANGQVLPPLNISLPAAILDTRGFFWDSVDAKIHPPSESQDKPADPPQRDGKPIEKQASLVAHAHPTSRLAAAAGAAAGVAPAAGPEAPVVPPITPDSVTTARQLAEQVHVIATRREKPLPFPLAQFQGAYAGNGFNTIWRPRAPADDNTTDFPFPQPVGPPDNILELNLTTEQLTFAMTLGDIPNRGLGTQRDKILFGCPYVQTVQDVTNIDSGKGDSLTPTGIHFEPGVWLYVPFADSQDKKIDSIVRMGSIPHGTTINAQGLIPKEIPQEPKGTKGTSLIGGTPGPIDWSKFPANTGPFFFGTDGSVEKNRLDETFHAMNADRKDTFRIPQDLTKFIETQTITTEIIKNPNKVLEKAVKDLKILEFITFEVSTGSPPPPPPPPVPAGSKPVPKPAPTAELNGGGTTNISFLAGKQAITTAAPAIGDAPIAHADFMKARYWIEVVEYSVEVPKVRKQATLLLKPTMPDNCTAPTPEFLVTTPVGGIPEKKPIKIPGLQIQTSQTVNLNFGPPLANLVTWPHVSVSTLVPKTPQSFQMR